MMRLDSEFAYSALRGRRHRFASGNGWYYGCQGLVPGVAVLRPYEPVCKKRRGGWIASRQPIAGHGMPCPYERLCCFNKNSRWNMAWARTFA